MTRTCAFVAGALPDRSKSSNARHRLRQSHKTVLLWIILILMFVCIYHLFTNPSKGEDKKDFGAFMTEVEDMTARSKIEKVAKKVYGAWGVVLYLDAQRRIRQYHEDGLDTLPICMAKTHLSLSHDPLVRNRPTGFVVPIRDIRVYSGAGMLVPLCGDMLQMPGFGAQPAAFTIDIDEHGETVGLF